MLVSSNANATSKFTFLLGEISPTIFRMVVKIDFIVYLPPFLKRTTKARNFETFTRASTLDDEDD